MNNDQPLVDMRSITKAFGGVVACDGVDFTLRRGEVHALLGENGAGKSTLMNVLSGALGDYRGELVVDGQVLALTGPASAHAAGISIIHQELDLVPSLTVAENLVLGREPRTWWRSFDRARAIRETRQALRRLDTDIEPTSRVAELSIGEQQLVAIASALYSDARILIMDEPTSALGQAETERLFAVIDTLRREGVGIVYISHRLEEVFSLADRITVLRDGHDVGTVLPEQTSAQHVISLMVGQELVKRSSDEQATNGGAPESGEARQPLLELTDLRARTRHTSAGRTDPDGVSLTVASGEIVGLAGLLGAGRTELLETVFGAASGSAISGDMRWQGRRTFFRSPRQAMAAGVCFVPEDRKAAGLFFHHSVASNLTASALHRMARAGFVRRRSERRLVRDLINELGIRTAGSSVLVGALSGGNQQKVVIGRQLMTEPRLLLLDDPTRGVDVGAKAEIYRVLRELANTGLGVLMASSELPELVEVCHRVVVLRQGQVMADRPSAELSQQAILAAAQGESI